MTPLEGDRSGLRAMYPLRDVPGHAVGRRIIGCPDLEPGRIVVAEVAMGPMGTKLNGFNGRVFPGKSQW